MLILIIRTIIIYFIIIAAVRLMGKRQIGDLQTTELVITLLISDLAVMPLQNRSEPFINGLLPIIVLVLTEILVSILMLKSGKIRKILCGSPAIIIYDGKIIQRKLKSLRMSTEDLFETLRQKDIFCLDNVKYAIVETNGKLSIILKAPYDNVKVCDMNIKPKDNKLEAAVISDGIIQEESLRLCRKDREWIYNIINNSNLKLKDIFIMTADASGKYRIIKKDKHQ